MSYLPAGGDYLETANLKLCLTTGRVWRRLHDEERLELIGHIEDDSNYPWDISEEWEGLRIEWEDRCQCGDAYEATVDHGYYSRLSAPCWN